MNATQLNGWWASLTIGQKEQIATKGWSIDHDEPIPYGQTPLPYPKCTSWWNLQSDERKQKIYDSFTESPSL